MSKTSSPPIIGRPAGLQDDLIYDVGAHLGEDSAFYLKLGFRVVAVEANPQLAQKLRERFSKEAAARRFILVEKAIAERPGEIRFFVNDKVSVWGTADLSWAERNERVGAPSRAITVAAVPFADLLREHGMPYYLKVDIEGADRLCIEALASFDERPKYVSIESEGSRWRDLLAEFDALERLGYRRFQVVRQGVHGSGRFLDRSGQPVEARFDIHSSGPFGSHLGGRWLTRRQALRRYRWVFLRYRLIADDTPFGRLLGKIPLLRRIPDMAGWYDTHAMR